MLLLVQLVFGFAVVLAPGALVARALGVVRLSATVAWALAVVFAALAVTFLVSASLDLTLVLLLATGLAALPVVARRRRAGFVSNQHKPAVPGRGWVFAAGALLSFVFRDRAKLAQHPYYGWNQRQSPTRNWHRIRR